MVKGYFAACEQAFPAQRAQLRRLSLALRRGGVERMEQLCALQRAGPEGLLELRSIGAKSLPLIEAVCARYEENRIIHRHEGSTVNMLKIPFFMRFLLLLGQECPPAQAKGGTV